MRKRKLKRRLKQAIQTGCEYSNDAVFWEGEARKAWGAKADLQYQLDVETNAKLVAGAALHSMHEQLRELEQRYRAQQRDHETALAKRDETVLELAQQRDAARHALRMQLKPGDAVNVIGWGSSPYVVRQARADLVSADGKGTFSVELENIRFANYVNLDPDASQEPFVVVADENSKAV